MFKSNSLRVKLSNKRLTAALNICSTHLAYRTGINTAYPILFIPYRDYIMQLRNRDNIEIVDSFIRLFGGLLDEIAPHYQGAIEFRILKDSENEYHDIMGRIGNTIYLSPLEIERIALTDVEILAALAHEVGHVVYNTKGWEPDCEQRADTLAAELGLGTQMISAIEKIIDSRRFHKLTSMLVDRIHFLQNMMRG